MKKFGSNNNVTLDSFLLDEHEVRTVILLPNGESISNTYIVPAFDQRVREAYSEEELVAAGVKEEYRGEVL